MNGHQSPLKSAQRILVTVSGPDREGITQQLSLILVHTKVKLLDIGQAVVHGWLSLSFLFEISVADSEQEVVRALKTKALELGLKCEAQVFRDEPLIQSAESAQPLKRYVVSLISSEGIEVEALSEVTDVLVRLKWNIDRIERLSDVGLFCLELQVSTSSDAGELRRELLKISSTHGVDLGLQAEGIYRRAKRLVVFDMDSTLIQSEVIDEFARELGMYDEVSRITHEAMKGQIEFDEALRLRVSRLAGLTLEQIERVYQRIEFTPGAEELIRILKRLGYKTALISGGFSCVADRIRDRLGLDYAHANHLVIQDGVLTGEVLLPIINAQRKADLLEVIAAQEGIDLEQVIAIGDGANDLLMLDRAGLGIAFNAKLLVQEKADLAMNHRDLRNVLYLLGISNRDLETV